MSPPITETITTTREVTGVIADLIKFAREMHFEPAIAMVRDDFMLRKARAYWDREHGEE